MSGVVHALFDVSSATVPAATGRVPHPAERPVKDVSSRAKRWTPPPESGVARTGFPGRLPVLGVVDTVGCADGGVPADADVDAYAWRACLERLWAGAPHAVGIAEVVAEPADRRAEFVDNAGRFSAAGGDFRDKAADRLISLLLLIIIGKLVKEHQ